MRSPRRNCASMRGLHLGLADHVLAGIGGELVGFLQQIDDRAHAGRQSIRVAGEPRGLLDHPGHRVAVERPQLLAPADGADQPRIEQRRLGAPLDPVVEIGGDLEQLGEFLVMVAQQVVESRRTDQHDLDVERDRLRCERHRARHAQQLLQCLDADLAGIERALQRGPAVIAGQQLVRRRESDSRHWPGAARPGPAG